VRSPRPMKILPARPTVAPWHEQIGDPTFGKVPQVEGRI
jgi:hypothetical protein